MFLAQNLKDNTKKSNMEQTDIHFRTGGNITHAGIEVLPSGKDIDYIVLESIEFKESERINGRTQEGVWIGHFAPNPYTSLPWVINSTNRRRLAKLFPECDGYLARLHNVAIRLTKEKTRDPVDGGDCWGLRVSLVPASKPIDWAQSNNKTIADIEGIYSLSDEQKSAIEKALTGAKDDLPE